MSEKMKCSSCGELTAVQAINRINVKEDPDIKAKVKDGSLFMWQCPYCGKTNLIQGQTLYHDPDNHLMIWLLPAGSLTKEQEELLSSQFEKLSESLEGYTLRRVDDIGTLIEKVNIFDAGLDDCAIEMCKYVTKMELSQKGSQQKEESETMKSASFKFYRMEGADNDIELSYPSNGQMQGVRIGFNVYEDCAAIIRRNPSVKPDAGFARVDQVWTSRFFR